MDLFSVLWEWDNFDEPRRLQAYFRLGDILEALASPAEIQANLYSGCPYCELASAYRSSREDYEWHCEALYPPSLMASLDRIQAALDVPCDCFDSQIFTGDSWSLIRSLAVKAKEEMKWEEALTSREFLGCRP
ncbi:hypothetical protein [Roseateles sp. L2-2]|uniref:hypothetical protein n=1 Tax=Roseateles TaxID=93681 RepID=UPI003D35DDA5